MNISDPKATRETVYPYAEPGDLIGFYDKYSVLTDFIGSKVRNRELILEGGLTWMDCDWTMSNDWFAEKDIIRKSDPRYPELLKTAIRPRTWRGVDYMDQHKEVGP